MVLGGLLVMSYTTRLTLRTCWVTERQHTRKQCSKLVQAFRRHYKTDEECIHSNSV